jgi:hypothetical protein
MKQMNEHENVRRHCTGYITEIKGYNGKVIVGSLVEHEKKLSTPSSPTVPSSSLVLSMIVLS